MKNISVLSLWLPMIYRPRYTVLARFVLLLLALTGCDAMETATVDLAADQTAAIDQATDEVLNEVAHLTQIYDDLVRDAGKNTGRVYVPAGSNDALADAIAQAGDGGFVVLAPGEHHESQTVAISHGLVLVGEPGATLIVDTHPIPVVATLHPALHIKDAAHVAIWGIEIVPKAEVGGTAILAERAPHLVVGRTTIREHQIGVAIHRTDHARIILNRMEMSSAPNITARQGVLVISGAHAVIASNTVSNTTAGFFNSNKQGTLIRNETYGNFLGVIVCKPNPQPAPNGDILEADISATEWLINLNEAHDNGWGFLFIDGANANLLAPNTGPGTMHPTTSSWLARRSVSAPCFRLRSRTGCLRYPRA